MGMVTQGALTGLWAAAPLRAAGAPDVTAAGVGAALTPADAQEEEDKEDSQADDDHEQPVCRETRPGPEPGGLGRNRDTGQIWVGQSYLQSLLGEAAVLARGWSTAAEGCPPLYNPGQPVPVREFALGSLGKDSK